MRNIRYRKKQVHKLLSFLTTEIPVSEVSILHILACLQLLLSDEFSEDNEINDGDIKKQKRHKISGVLCNDNDYVLSPDKMYWIKMIDNYVYLNTGRIDVQSKYMDFLLIFYSIKKKIHSAKNINRMQNIHEIYYKALADFIFRNI